MSRSRKGPAPESRRRAAAPALGAAALVVLVLAAYLPVLGNGFVWDDDDNVGRKAALRGLDGLERIWLDPSSTQQYYPMTHTTFWLEYALWGRNPLGYHLANVLLHAGCALLLWRVLRALHVPGAWVAAAVFAVHPVHVESVAWVTERKTTLSGVFYLASLLLWLRAWLAGREPGGAARPGAVPSRRTEILAFALFCCALLSKTVTATLPVVLALVLWWKRLPLQRKQLAWLGAMTTAGVFMGLVTAYLESVHVGAEGLEWSLTPMGRLLLAGRVPWFYLGKLVWPSGLTFMYPRWTIVPTSAVQYLPLAGTVASSAALFACRSRLGRGPFTAVACFLVTLSPALGFFNVYAMRYSYVADYFQYLASIGLIALGVAAAALSIPPIPRLRTASTVVPIVLLLALGAVTWRQSRDYRDEETLWWATLERNPAAWIAHANLGKILTSQGRPDEAIAQLRQVLESRPDDPESYNLLGAALLKRGDADGAIEVYRNAVRLDPRSSLLYYNLGIALGRKGLLPEAISAYRDSLRINPRALPALSNLAIALFRSGAYEESRDAVQALRRLGGNPNPEFVQDLEEALRGSWTSAASEPGR